ncbi:MAG: RsmB/NOP family class I SAM-dependent RNA methyltransferase [Pseudomonadota bacterium]
MTGRGPNGRSAGKRDKPSRRGGGGSGSGGALASGVSARAAALDALIAISDKHVALDEAIERAFAKHAMAPRDRAFARLIVTTTLRRRGQVDWLIAQLRDREGEIGPARLLEIVRMGLAQLVFLKTPPYAAVSSALGLLEGTRERKARGLVNAMLRQADRTAEEWAEAPQLGDDAEGARRNLPDWLMEGLTGGYGRDGAGQIAAAHLVEPPLDLTSAVPADDIAGALDADILPTGGLRRANSGTVNSLPGFEDGTWWVQDAAASLPARLFGSVKGETVVDLCAAPGGKTAQLAAAGAKVIAVDRSKNRLGRLRDNMKRLSLEADMVCSDALVWKPKAPISHLLLDAPCSATGTIRRHPDIPWVRRPRDIERLIDLQDRLLRRAVDLLAPGGTLVWCTCSLLPAEGEERIEALLAEGAPLERVPVSADEIGGLAEAITDNGEVRTLPTLWPDRGGMDGFHIARLRKAH